MSHRLRQVALLWAFGSLGVFGCTDPDTEADQGATQAGEEQAGEAVEAGAEGGVGEVGGTTEDAEAHPRYAVQMLGLVNALRAEGVTCGSEVMPPVGPLTLNHQLDEAALLHAQDMADQGYFEHVSLDGREPWDRMNDSGYFGSAYGENIAAGLPGVGATFDQWVNSPGHCSNMMSSDFRELGVGYHPQQGTQYTHYWVQNFGSP